MADTFIDDIEKVVEEVSNWAVEAINLITRTLAPDGRGFLQVEIPTEQKLDEYRKFRNDINANLVFISQKTLEIQNFLLNAGVPQDMVAALDLKKIAQGLLLKYSSDMEEELNKRMI